MNTKLPLLLLIVSSLALPGCYPPPQQAYYVSPVNGYATQYHPLPQVTDSTHTAFYAEAGFFSGSANTHGKDYLNAFHGSFTIAHHTGNLQAWYGGDLSLGTYHMGYWDTSVGSRTYPIQSTVPFQPDVLDNWSGAHSFGAVGFHGGANVVVPMNGGEWRVIGVEGSVNHEFGQYLAIRQKIPDSAASIIARGAAYGTFGINSEIVGSTKNGEFGFRMAVGTVIGNPYTNPHVYDYSNGHSISYGYLCLSTHYTYQKYTFYGQLNFATKADGISFGLAYRLNKPRVGPAKTSHRREVLYGK
ncbi:MAG TPA: hypothetical protein VHC96_05610 [Puia sp.]|jgi:hypothetical protein|nr:hypothetical protein [Puia sp.]